MPRPAASAPAIGLRRINIGSSPPGATVRLDAPSSEPLGTTPLRNRSVLAGPHALFFELRGYGPERFYIYVARDGETFTGSLQLSAPLRPPTAADGNDLPERPTRSQITTVLSALNGPVRFCANGRTGTAPVMIEIGNDGLVRSARVTGEFAETTEGRCIEDVVRRARFPAFRAPEVRLIYPFVVLPPRP